MRRNKSATSCSQISNVNSRSKKVLCTVSAAALMLGVSSAATVGLHFQLNYCGAPAYSGYPVTMTAFGVPTNGWENLTEMNTGYGSCAGPLGYTNNEVIDTTTATDGLNPLPTGSLNVTWSASTANFSGFYGYGAESFAPPPTYAHAGSVPPIPFPTGESEVYLTFLRDGLNFGPGSSSGNNDQPGYLVDITGLKSLFTNSYVVELIAAGDSIDTLTNAYVVDVANSLTNTVAYTNTPPVNNDEGTSYTQGQGGGLSTVTGAMNADHLQIMSAHPQHVAGGYNHAGTISGFIVTDKPVVTMSPQTVLSGLGDTVYLSAYAIGVPPLSYQWRYNGKPIANATNLSYAVTNVTISNAGGYDLVVTNLYGAATSAEALVGDPITRTSVSDVIFDSNPVNPQRSGTDDGATWLASSSDGSTTREGVMQFNPAETNGITTDASTNFDSNTGTIMMWIRSAGTDTSDGGSEGGAIFAWQVGQFANQFVLAEEDNGTIFFSTPGSADYFISKATVTDDKWHFLALTYNDAANGTNSLYIDGMLDTSSPNAGAWTLPTTPDLQFGYSSDGSWEAYDGQMDDIRIYNTALSAANINSIYTSDAVVNTNALQLWYNFNTPPSTGIALNWQNTNAVLQSSTNVAGPYHDLPGTTVPFVIVPPASGSVFFRYRTAPTAPQSVVSNPYLM